MKYALAAISLLMLVNCSDNPHADSLPLRGTVRGNNPQAAALFQQAKALEQANEYKDALRNYRKLLKAFPADRRAAESRFREAHILNASGNHVSAFDSYQKFIERYPGNQLYSQAIRQQEIVAHTAASGAVTTNFLGLKSGLERKTIVRMLEKVRDNAPRAHSAPRAQFKIGQVNEAHRKLSAAVASYEKLVADFPNTKEAPGAQFRVGEILLRQAKDGNQDQANLEYARNAYRDLLLSYPRSSFAPQARQRIATIGSQDLLISYNIAQFYDKKEQYASAAYYYQEVVRLAPAGDLKNHAAARLAQLTQGQ